MAGLADYLFGTAGGSLPAYQGPQASAPAAAGSELAGVPAGGVSLAPMLSGLKQFGAAYGRAAVGEAPPAQPIAVQPQAPPQAPQAAPAWTTNPVSSSFTPGPMFRDLLQFRGTPSAQPAAAAAQGPQFSAMPAGPGVSFAPGVNARPATAGLTFQQAIALHQLAKPVLTPVEQAQQTLHGMAMQQNTYEARRKALLDMLPSFGANYQMFRNAAGSGVGTGYPE